jgi:predicted ATP-dependent serine protease
MSAAATVWCADCGDAYDAPLGCCPNCECVERLTERTKIIVTLEVAGSPDDAMTAVDQALDEGVLQDFLNQHDIEDVGPVHVLTAVARFDGSENT